MDAHTLLFVKLKVTQLYEHMMHASTSLKKNTESLKSVEFTEL